MTLSHLALVALTQVVVAAAQSSTANQTSAAGQQQKKPAVDPLSWHHAFGWALYILVGCALLFGIVGRFAACVSYYMSQRIADSDLPPSESAPRNPGILSKAHTLFRRHVSVPATFGKHHMRPVGGGWFSVPTRLQAIMIFIFVALNIIFSFVGINRGNNGPKIRPLAKQIGDRSGIMAFYNLPLLWALAGRNDILLWLTGWSYRSMNLFHRWAARMCVLHAIIHSVAYTWMSRDKLADKFKSPFWSTGIFATVLLCILIPLSVRPFRTRFYEIFLITHIVLSVAILVLLFFHVRVMAGAYNAWLWTCVGIWAFDRLVRFLRIAVLSFKTTKIGPNGRNAVARIADSRTGLIRLSVDTSAPVNPTAGSYYFLYSPWSTTSWQSHPFSLASWEPSGRGSGTTLHFLVAPRAGATRRLRRKIEKYNEANTEAANAEVPLRILTEGPYGVRHPVHSFDHILLIAGGTGITALLPYVFELNRMGHRHVSVVWIVKDNEYASDVLSRELSPDKRGFANVQVYLSTSTDLSRNTSDASTLSSHTFGKNTFGQKTGMSMCSDQSLSSPSSEYFSEKTPSAKPDLKAHLVMKKKFLQADSRAASFTSNASSITACESDKTGMSMCSDQPLSSPSSEYFSEKTPSAKPDLMAHLVMKKKFLQADSRAASFTSNASSVTACESDETVTLDGRDCSKYCKSSSISSTGSHCYLPGRPAMADLISAALGNLVGSERQAVLACGPWGMMDDLRAAVAESYGTGPGQVSASTLEYFEDAFEW